MMSKTLIKNGRVITMDAQNSIYETADIEIDGGKIRQILPHSIDAGSYDRVIDASHMAVLPGLINVHTHVCGALFKGMLEDTINGFYGTALPMESNLTPDFVYSLSMAGAAECLMGGTTLINDLYHNMGSTARAILDLGMRGVLANKVYDVDLMRIQYKDYTRDYAAGQRRLEENIELIENYHLKGDGRILCKFGPHATDTVSLELARQISMLGEKYGVGFHVHASQMPQEVEFLRETYNLSPIEYLYESQLMGENTTVAHCLHVDNEDIQLLAHGKAMLAHCPDMNGNKGGPLAPIKKMYDAGVRVGYGTDWTASDLWSTMRMGVTVGRLLGCEQTQCNALDALRRCTIEPAKHLGLEHMIGSLEVGKCADLIMVDLRSPNLCPINDDLVSTLVYNANCHDVHTVMVNGRVLVENKRLVSIDIDDIIDNSQYAADHIRTST